MAVRKPRKKRAASRNVNVRHVLRGGRVTHVRSKAKKRRKTTVRRRRQTTRSGGGFFDFF